MKYDRVDNILIDHHAVHVTIGRVQPCIMVARKITRTALTPRTDRTMFLGPTPWDLGPLFPRCDGGLVVGKMFREGRQLQFCCSATAD